MGDDDYAQYAVAIANGIDSINNSINASRNREFQSEEAEKVREWSSSEAGLNRAWEEEMYNKYNSPTAMMRQYKAAGLNPYLLGGGTGLIGQGMSLSAPMAPSSPLPSGAQAAPSLMAGNYAQMVGINAQAANQHAQAIQQKWETYQYIREHVGKDAAQKYLDNNPDMLQSSDPDNDPWMKAYKRSELRETIQNEASQWELDLKRLYGVKQAELDMNYIKTQTDDLASQMNQRSWNVKEIRKTLDLIDEKIKTERSVQSKNYSEASLSSARARTEDQSRQYVVSQLLYRTGILNHASQMDNAVFESKESLRGWLSSNEAKKAFAEAARNRGLWNADAVRTSFLEFLDHVQGFNPGSVSGSYESASSRGSLDYNHSVDGARSSTMNVSY